MISVTPGQKLPLSYVFPTAATPRIVKATIENFAGIVLATIALTEVNPGDQQDNSFPMPSGIDFLKVKFTPYLNDGVTEDSANPITQEVFGTITPILASPLHVLIGCQDQPTQKPVLTSQNSNPAVLLQLQDKDGNPLNASTASFIAMRVKKGLSLYQTDALSVSTLAASHVYSLQIDYVTVSYTSTGLDTQQSILAALLTAIPLAFPDPAAAPVGGVVTGTGVSAVLTLTAVAAGTDVVYGAIDSDLALVNQITNTLEKNASNGITAVAGAQGQYLVQFTAQDVSLLPTGTVDSAIVLTQGGVTTVTNVYGSMVIQSDILSD